MAQRAGGEGSPKKKTSLNLVTGFYHYLRGKCERECVSHFEMDGVRKSVNVCESAWHCSMDSVFLLHVAMCVLQCSFLTKCCVDFL